jgi:hypothetical protein
LDSRGLEAYQQIIYASPSRPPAPAIIAANPSLQTTVAKPGAPTANNPIPQTKVAAKRKRQKFSSKRERETSNPAMFIQASPSKKYGVGPSGVVDTVGAVGAVGGVCVTAGCVIAVCCFVQQRCVDVVPGGQWCVAVTVRLSLSLSPCWDGLLNDATVGLSLLTITDPVGLSMLLVLGSIPSAPSLLLGSTAWPPIACVSSVDVA